jgi:phthalate 4,5-cis-dihydrodiol dehydrogenase
LVRLGVIGLGAAGQAFLPAIERHPAFTMAAVCDPQPSPRSEAAEKYAARSYADVTELLNDGALDAVYIGTPTDLHFEHARAALEAGLHVLLEKPMTIRRADALALAELAERSGRALTVGHSHSHDLPIRTMREIILSGRLGAPRMINTWCFSEWVYRPRRPDELRPELGGGVTFRQGGHQFDILLALAQSDVVSVKARTFDFDPSRSTIGAHSVTLDFANGAIGTAIYNGYGFFQSSELTEGMGEWGFPVVVPEVHPRRAAASGVDELTRKARRARTAIRNDAPAQPQFGLTLVSCERGDMRQTPRGLLIYTEDGREERILPTDRSPRHLVLDEFADAIAGRPVPHNARRGAAVVEICEAVLRSAREGREIRLAERGPEGVHG